MKPKKVNPNDVVKALRRVMELPENVLALDMSLTPSSVTVRCEMIPVAPQDAATGAESA